MVNLNQTESPMENLKGQKISVCKCDHFLPIDMDFFFFVIWITSGNAYFFHISKWIFFNIKNLKVFFLGNDPNFMAEHKK